MAVQATTPEEIKRQIDDLLRRHDTVVKKKAGLGGQIQAKKDELNQIIQEVRAAGFDPKTLANDRDKSQQDLQSMIADFDAKLTEVEAHVAAFDKK
jgi:uncharacterized protein YoxC